MIQNSIYFLVLLIGFSSCKTEKVALQEGTVLLNYQKPLIIDESTNKRQQLLQKWPTHAVRKM